MDKGSLKASTTFGLIHSEGITIFLFKNGRREIKQNRTFKSEVFIRGFETQRRKVFRPQKQL